MEGDVGFMVLNHSRDLLSTPVMQSEALAVDGTPSAGHLLHAEAYSHPTRAAAWQSSAAMSMHADNTPPRLRQAHAPMGDAREGDVGFMVFDHSHDQPSTPVMQSLAMHVDGTPSTGLLSIYNQQQAPGSQDTERTRSQQQAPPGTQDTERTWTQQAPGSQDTERTRSQQQAIYDGMSTRLHDIHARMRTWREIRGCK